MSSPYVFGHLCFESAIQLYVALDVSCIKKVEEYCGQISRKVLAD